MLLSRKRARDTLPALPALRHRASDLRPHIDEKWFLRDLLDTCDDGGSVSGCIATKETEQRVHARRQVVEFLHRHNRIPEHVVKGSDVCDNSLQLSRARMSSQELFLSVVLEWQRAETHAHHHAQSQSHPTVANEHNFVAASSSHRGYLSPAMSQSSRSSSANSDVSSSDSELDDIQSRHVKRQHLNEDVSPTSVHNVPRELPPLHLDYVATAPVTKRMIGIYSPRSRQELLRKYMAKREKRLSQHTVRYRVRKTLANARPRVKGRFVKTVQPLTAALAESMGGSDGTN